MIQNIGVRIHYRPYKHRRSWRREGLEKGSQRIKKGSLSYLHEAVAQRHGLGLERKSKDLSTFKGNQSWIFIGRTDADTEAPTLWPPDAKKWLIGKDPDAGKDCRYRRQVMGGLLCDCCVTVGSWNFERGTRMCKRKKASSLSCIMNLLLHLLLSHLQRSSLNW